VSQNESNDEAQLIEKLRKLEALFDRPGTAGERAAAASACDRIRERLRQLEKTEPTVEFKFAMQNQWSHHLFIALARRYGLSPFRYRGQRRTTIMLKATRTFVDETFWPEFREADTILQRHFHEVTRRVVAQAISGDMTEPEERAGGSESGSTSAIDR
jgi:hypothetical protein